MVIDLRVNELLIDYTKVDIFASVSHLGLGKRYLDPWGGMWYWKMQIKQVPINMQYMQTISNRFLSHVGRRLQLPS